MITLHDIAATIAPMLVGAAIVMAAQFMASKQVREVVRDWKRGYSDGDREAVRAKIPEMLSIGWCHLSERETSCFDAEKAAFMKLGAPQSGRIP